MSRRRALSAASDLSRALWCTAPARHRALHSPTAGATPTLAIRARAAAARQLCAVPPTSAAPPLRADEIDREVDAVNELFAEARLSLGDVMDAVGSVYFESDLEDARIAVADTLGAWKTLLRRAPDDESRAALQRSMGLKMGQLEAELDSILEQLKDDKL